MKALVRQAFVLKNQYNSLIRMNNVQYFSDSTYKYDFFVIGGGSGGLAAAKQAADLGKNVGIADFVVPSPQNSKWGLGGTCLNVGCIPKKLLHTAALKYEDLNEYESIGLTVTYPTIENKDNTSDEFKKQKPKPDFNWNVLISKVQQYIKKSNFGNRSILNKKEIQYYNKYAKFVDANTIKLIDNKGNEELVTADKILISVGGRPNYGNYIGAKELCISSDDIFSKKTPPGKTLVVGASYIALECAGFLNGLGFDVSVMVRSILLRGFDQDMAERIKEIMQNRGITFIDRSTPIKFEKENNKIKVTFKKEDTESVDLYDTVLLAIGREAFTSGLELSNAGIQVDKASNKIVVNEFEQTSIPNIYAIGDCALGRPELTPSAIKAGRLLADRLFGSSDEIMEYKNIATTVFTPVEYGCVGYSEVDAIAKFGKKNIVVYHSEFTPLEWNLHEYPNDLGYAKIIVNINDQNRVIGIHILSPNAGEIVQGFSAAINCGLTKEQLDKTVSIHPTVAEELTMIKTDKSKGDGKKEGC